MELAEDRQIESEHPARSPQVRPGREDGPPRPHGLRPAPRAHLYPSHAPARRVDALDSALEEADTVSACLLEQIHAELLAAEPPAAPGVEEGNGVGSEPRIVTPDEGRLGDEIGASEGPLEAFDRRRPVVVR